jgi:heme exporter protein D
MKLDYVSASYVVFAVVMAWDYLSPRLHLARVRRTIRLRVRRAAAKAQA